ncbi:MAG: DUF2280 domain-containing protein [Acinetobacter populi]|uniref:DUF2280 domain-containing protein n=1 Tax=Acinetobacter populi TaxID=1582270 RepID=UPI002354DB10|nr:DUF2280 domain-containing protein [Acinetobacter populi]MCH4247604.1 DUF2280 domain-containing protein [Acinetobacter populi]
MARLNKKVKVFIVRCNAEFVSLQDTIKHVKDVFGIDVTPSQCEAYDPTKANGHNLSEELKQYFYKRRAETNDELLAIPVANKRYRLQKMQFFVDHDRFKENPVIVPKLLEQAAKEMGNQYTNQTKTELTGKDGKPLQTENITYVTAKPEDIKQVLDELESKY